MDLRGSGSKGLMPIAGYVTEELKDWQADQLLSSISLSLSSKHVAFSCSRRRHIHYNNPTVGNRMVGLRYSTVLRSTLL